jgi:hypothetical protein
MTKYLSLLFAALFFSLVFFGSVFHSVEASPSEVLITQVSVVKGQVTQRLAQVIAQLDFVQRNVVE